MKVYVDELPKSCNGCPMKRFIYDYGDENCYICGVFCSLSKTKIEIPNIEIEEKGERRCDENASGILIKSCPLQPIEKYTNQIREQVCSEIKVKSIKNYTLEHQIYTYCIEPHILDQIQGD